MHQRDRHKCCQFSIQINECGPIKRKENTRLCQEHIIFQTKQDSFQQDHTEKHIYDGNGGDGQ